MKHEQDHPLFSPSLNVLTATKEEIIKHFDTYGFKDQKGHPLTMCADFHDLLKRINFNN